MNNQKSRRNFLKLAGFITVSGVGTIVAGCGGGGSRGGGNFGITGTSMPAHTPMPKGSFDFPDGISSGDPKPHSIVLWTKIAPVAKKTDGEDLSVIIQVSNKPFYDHSYSSENLIVAHTILVHSKFDYTIHHRVEGLEAGRHYWYRFIIDNDQSADGRTKTAPTDDSITPIKFLYMSCQEWGSGNWDSFRLMAESQFDDLDFIVHLGDYIYETANEVIFQHSDAEPSHRNNLVDGGRLSGKRDKGSAYAKTLEDYRYLYSKYRSDPRIQAVHAKFPLIAIWDDHEFANDCWEDHETETAENLKDNGRRRDANRAWFENMPVSVEDVSFSPDVANYNNIKIYRDFTFGKVMRLIMTDERLYRSDHAIPEIDSPKILNKYFTNIINTISDLEDPKSLYAYLKRTTVLSVNLYTLVEAVIDEPEAEAAASSGFDFSKMFLDAALQQVKSLFDTTVLKPTILKFLNEKNPNPIDTTKKLTLETIFKNFKSIDLAKIYSLVGSLTGSSGDEFMASGSIGARYGVLDNVLAEYVKNNSNSEYAMLGEEQTRWWQAKMQDAQTSGTTWKIWGNEVCLANLPIDINRINNTNINLPAPFNLLGSDPISNLLKVAKYILTTSEVRQQLSIAASEASGAFDNLPYSSDGTKINTQPGQQIILFGDSWDGYQSSRNKLTSFLVKNQIDNVIAITGDLHTFVASQIVDRETKTPALLDFTGAGISSGGFDGGGLVRRLASKQGTNPLSGFSIFDGLKPMLMGMGLNMENKSALKDFVIGLISRSDKGSVDQARDLLSRLLVFFSDEAEWVETIAIGFATVELDIKQAKVTYHNVRVERDAEGLVMAPESYLTAMDPESGYQRRTHFLVKAKENDTTGSTSAPPSDAKKSAIWPAFPPRVIEYENPAVRGD